jgi:hypothetical protein
MRVCLGKNAEVQPTGVERCHDAKTILYFSLHNLLGYVSRIHKG